MSARPALVSALSAGAAYVATAVATFSGVFGQVDIDTLRFSESKDSYSLDLAGSVLSTLGGLPITLAATLILALIWTLRDGLRGAAPLGIAIVIVVGLLTQRLMPQPGPPLEALRDFHWLALSSGDNLSPQAFPSGHVARTTFLALLYAGRHPRTLPLMALLVGAMAVSRIYIGSHWTSDVLGGLLLGAAVALSLIALRSNLVPRAPA